MLVLLSDDFDRYSEGERAELEAALRTDDPAELERIYARWATAGPQGVLEAAPEPSCNACRRAQQFGYAAFNSMAKAPY